MTASAWPLTPELNTRTTTKLLLIALKSPGYYESDYHTAKTAILEGHPRAEKCSSRDFHRKSILQDNSIPGTSKPEYVLFGTLDP